jgi:branched-chain amino acid transport system substrate-binding protein
MAVVLALAMQNAGPGAGNAAIAQAVPAIAGPPGQKVSSFAEGKAALKAGQKINYEGASGPLDFDANGDAISVFGVNQVSKGALERKYLLK